MSKTQYFVAASLDGFIADADGKIEWLLAYDGADDIRQHYEAFIANIGALAMGARTYEFLLRHDGPWPYANRTERQTAGDRQLAPFPDLR